jgi:hypothetical protein
MNEQERNGRLAEEVERIVASGERVRERVHAAVTDAASRAAGSANTLQADAMALGRSALVGAARALERAIPTEQDSALRKVIEGVGDAVVRTAMATNLAVREASASGRAFAQEDLKRVAADLRGVRGLFVETVSGALKRLYAQGGERFDALRGHAERTAAAIEPSVKSALAAVTGDPLGTAGEAARAATGLAREGAGALFRSMGAALQRVGDRVTPGERRSDGPGDGGETPA